MKKAAVIALMVLLLAGCGFKDIDNQSFVMVIGIDDSGNPTKRYRVSLKLAVPSENMAPGQSQFQIVQQDASSVTEAVRLIKSKVDKELEFGHAKAIVLGKSLIQEGFSEPLDWLVRRGDIQMIGYMAVGEPTANAVLQVKSKSEQFPGDALFLSFDHEGTESSYTVTEYLSDFYRRSKERGKDPFLPVIRAEKDSYTINQVMLLNKDQGVLTLSPDQTRIFITLVRTFQRIELVTKTEKANFMLAVRDLHVKYNIQEAVGKQPPIVHLKVKMEGNIEETNHVFYNENWRSYEQEAEKQGEKRIQKLLELMQQKGVDPVGFGLRYQATHLAVDKAWNDWQSWYPKVQFDVKVQVKIASSGAIK
ncbi:Ger(x)C family spore germination protein [Paenibacillus sp. OV219]|uniref:Ger(x)C family spore germination protein n=1 Tax=Paenibacillus sp. OV219 TaxID=1884377 RepID=UPI0008BAAEFC|nr:Ger(x)C family spore germination protein [Paenibacillus sp. OV219]SEP18679.1 spore germination protein KC [Paenibacillus sp. OV219]